MGYSKLLQKVIDDCNSRKYPTTRAIQRLSLKERKIANHYIDCLTKENADKLKKLVKI
tara:strand:- start:496 stop:669 length:174 start_codon:yes stop_codon:yes gene_type:complete